eukprot:1190062-Prorocentrum_minimum.AAC.1
MEWGDGLAHLECVLPQHSRDPQLPLSAAAAAAAAVAAISVVRNIHCWMELSTAGDKSSELIERADEDRCELFE